MDVLLAVAGIAALAVFLWCAAGLMLFPVSGEDAVLLWRMKSPCTPEYRVRGYLWLLHTGLCGARLVLVDCGLSPEDRRQVELLAEQEPMIELVTEDARKTDREMVRNDGTGT